MPTYQYACTDCGHRFEEVQAFSDPSLTVCPACAGRLRKVYGSVGVVFKGSGFYRNDSRDAKGKSGAPVSAGADSSGGDSGSGSSGSADSGAPTPAGGKEKAAPVAAKTADSSSSSSATKTASSSGSSAAKAAAN